MGITIFAAGDERIDAVGLTRFHERLLHEFGVRYLDCEGGATILAALHEAGLVDEIFVTVTDVHIDPSAHARVKRLFSLDGARLMAEGHTAPDAGYVFRRWRFTER